ncbi:hypothetical protein Nepgr_008501 [Nepenthes gracilis]|uniref:Uncharacterized protein n=1 Tax=Nepenthes gracilis TaxID=150966 RepID=A0AAD3XJH9_NEPGR|nr:hypothetical protein Nepgr_008501 [Nepenthes gracilis]
MKKSRTFAENASPYVRAQQALEDHPKSYSFNGPSSKGDNFGASGDPEMKRKKRVASYNMYTMEGTITVT